MKPILAHSALILSLLLSSCTIGGKQIALVNDRNENGTFKPVKEVLHPTTGAAPIASGRLYLYPEGDVAVSGSLTQPLAGKALKLKR